MGKAPRYKEPRVTSRLHGCVQLAVCLVCLVFGQNCDTGFRSAGIPELSSGSLGSGTLAPPPTTPPAPSTNGCALTPDQLIPSWAAKTLAPGYVPFTDYYVSPNGSDTNDGLSLSKAFLTTAQAMTRIGPGVRLNFAAGTYGCAGYTGSTRINGGTANPSVIRSLDGPRAAKFNCSAGGNFSFQQAQGLVIEGLEIFNVTNSYAIYVLSNVPWDPNNLAGDVLIHNSYIHDTWGIKSSQAKNLTLIGNEFASLNRPGRQMIQMVAVDNVILAGNYGHDSTNAFDEVKGGAHGAIIYKNVLVNTAGGIMVGGDDTGTQFLTDPTVDFELENARVWDNVIINDSINAFRITGCHNCTVTNNTYWTTSSAHAMMILPDIFTPPSGPNIPLHNVNVLIENNIFASSSTLGYLIGDPDPNDGVTMKNNVWYWATGATPGSDLPFLGEPGSIYGNPKLKSPTADLHPAAGSPVIGKGLPIPFVTNNADGVCWTGALNIGAY